MVRRFIHLTPNNRLIATADGNLVFHFPSSNFHASVDVNSQRGIEPHSLETSIGLESINLTVDLIQELIGRLKPRNPTKPPPTPSSPFSPATSSLFSPTSPAIHFMVRNLIRVEFFCSHPFPAIASRIRPKGRSQEIVP